jgi:hypothetical protein
MGVPGVPYCRVFPGSTVAAGSRRPQWWVAVYRLNYQR